jgi:hypothetical protein
MGPVDVARSMDSVSITIMCSSGSAWLNGSSLLSGNKQILTNPDQVGRFL